MSVCGESEVVLNTSQRQPPALRRCPTRCPAQRLKHALIAAMDIGEIHGQVPGSAIEDRAKFSSQSLRSVVIEMPRKTTRAYWAPPRTVTIASSGQCSTVLPVDTHWSVPPGSGAACRTGSARLATLPSTHIE